MNWKVIDRLLLPAIFFLGAMLAALMLWVLLIFHQRAEIGATTAQQAVFVKTKTESELRDRILPLVRLAARWQTLDQPTDSEMESDAGLVMNGNAAYRAIAFLGPAF